MDRKYQLPGNVLILLILFFTFQEAKVLTSTGSYNWAANVFLDGVVLVLIPIALFFAFYKMLSTAQYSLSEKVFGVFVALTLDLFVFAIIMSSVYSISVSVVEILLLFTVQFFSITAVKGVLHAHYEKNKRLSEILLIGPATETEKIAKKMLASNKEQVKIKFIMNTLDSKTLSLIHEVDKVFICNTMFKALKDQIIDYSVKNNKEVYLVPELYDISLVESEIVQFDDVPVFKIGTLGLSNEQKMRKRLFDIVMSTIGIVIGAPIMLVVALLIKLQDGGPIFFNQDRLTENGKTFYVHKFRSMIKDAEKHTGPVLATDKDPRITKLGAFLRSTRLDELPQLLNVFKGDMSLIGPRPERQFFADQFTEQIPVFKYRLTVKAGVTGLAQVMANYTTTPEDKLIYDLLYIRNYSFLLDLKIFIQTIRIALTKEASAGLKANEALEQKYQELIKTTANS